MEEHVAEVKKLMDTAQRELYRAQEKKYRADNTERENARRRDEHYPVGENVLLPPALNQGEGAARLRAAPARARRGRLSINTPMPGTPPSTSAEVPYA